MGEGDGESDGVGIRSSASDVVLRRGDVSGSGCDKGEGARGELNMEWEFSKSGDGCRRREKVRPMLLLSGDVTVDEVGKALGDNNAANDGSSACALAMSNSRANCSGSTGTSFSSRIAMLGELERVSDSRLGLPGLGPSQEVREG